MGIWPRPLRRFLPRKRVCLDYLDYQRCRISLRRYNRRTYPQIDYSTVHNVFPNSGPVPIRQDFSSAREVVAAFRDPNKRSQEIEGFEGFAPDDAVFDEGSELWELWSNARLAGTIAAWGYADYENPSILELGCGPAHLFFFFTRYGIQNYVGIDGNPLAIKFNGRLRGSEHHFLTLNLQQEIRLQDGSKPLAFDIVCCFEVLEHIREDVVDELIRTIRNHMRPGSLALCTASLQDQMDVHVLVRSREWWLKRFEKLGLCERADAARLCRQLGINHPFNWSPDNTNVFALEIRNVSS